MHLYTPWKRFLIPELADVRVNIASMKQSGIKATPFRIPYLSIPAVENVFWIICLARAGAGRIAMTSPRRVCLCVRPRYTLPGMLW